VSWHAGATNIMAILVALLSGVAFDVSLSSFMIAGRGTMIVMCLIY